MKKQHMYALYKGDTFIDLGTKKYLADKLGVNESTIDYYGTKAYQKRHDKRDCYIVIWIRDDKNE